MNYTSIDPKPFFPKQFTAGFSLRKKGWPRYALATFPALVRHASALRPPCVQLVSALCAPPNQVRLCPPCIRLRPLWPRLQTLCLPCCPLSPPCVRSLSSLSSFCPLVVLALSALCRPLSGSMVFGFGRAFVSSVFAAWSLLFCLPRLVTLAGSARVCLERSRAFAPCLLFPPLSGLYIFV